MFEIYYKNILQNMGNLFCKKQSFEDEYTDSFFNNTENILATTNLSSDQKVLFRRRYMNKLYSLRHFKHNYAVWFYLHRFLATTLGVSIPALLSIQYYFNEGSVSNPIYWSAWSLSILGGFATGYNNVFKVDERYFLLRGIYQKLKSEGWSFLLLCKKYDQRNELLVKMTHSALFVGFMESIEDIVSDYMKNDMETVKQDSKTREEQNMMVQQRALELVNQHNSAPQANNQNENQALARSEEGLQLPDLP